MIGLLSFSKTRSITIDGGNRSVIENRADAVPTMRPRKADVGVIHRCHGRPPSSSRSVSMALIVVMAGRRGVGRGGKISQ